MKGPQTRDPIGPSLRPELATIPRSGAWGTSGKGGQAPE